MAQHIPAASRGIDPILQVCGVSAGSMRLAWAYPSECYGKDGKDADALHREAAIAEHQRRFLRTTERYLKGELDEPPRLGAWRRK